MGNVNKTHIEPNRVLSENHGLYVTPLCYGCAGAWGRTLISDETAISLLERAYTSGINFFDTGHSYGCAEERIGKAISASTSISRDRIVISTKFGTRIVDGKPVHDTSVEWMKRSVELSLLRMGIDCIDLLYVHGPTLNDLTDTLLLDELDALKRQGIIKLTGANTFDTPVIERIYELECFDVIMLDYNIARRDREPQIERLAQKGIKVIAGQALAESVFLNSIFSLKTKKDIWYLARTFGRKSSRELYFKTRKLRFLNSVDGIDGSQAALSYVLSNPNIVSASFGSCSFEHIDSNVKASEVVLPAEILAKIKAVM